MHLIWCAFGLVCIVYVSCASFVSGTSPCHAHPTNHISSTQQRQIQAANSVKPRQLLERVKGHPLPSNAPLCVPDPQGGCGSALCPAAADKDLPPGVPSQRVQVIAMPIEFVGLWPQCGLTQSLLKWWLCGGIVNARGTIKRRLHRLSKSKDHRDNKCMVGAVRSS